MGFVQLADVGGYHHAIVLSPATYARQMYAENISADESYWKSEDAAWHLATQLMSRYSNLTVLGCRASFPVAPEVWMDAACLNACFFSQASRIIILVPSDAEEHIKIFTQTCLVPLLTRTEEAGGRPDWRDRFVAAAIGNVRVPSQLAPGIPFIKVIRFREIGWVRDITAMMLLQRAIQEFWIPSKVKFAKSIPYQPWQWSQGGRQLGYSMSETIETKATVGMSTHVTGQMEPIAECGRSKSVDSRRSSGRRRHPTNRSRSRSRSRQSTSSGYRSLDPEFEAQQIEEMFIDTRVINLLNGCESTYLKEPSSVTVPIGETTKIDVRDGLPELSEARGQLSPEPVQMRHPLDTKETNAPVLGLNSTEEISGSASNADTLPMEASSSESKTPHVDTEDKPHFSTISRVSSGKLMETLEERDDTEGIPSLSGADKSNLNEAKVEQHRREENLVSTDFSEQHDETSTTSLQTDISTVKVIEDAENKLSRQTSFAQSDDDTNCSHEEHISDNKAGNVQQVKDSKALVTTVTTTSSKIQTLRKLNVVLIDKVAESFSPDTLQESVGRSQHSPILITKSAESVKPEKSKSPPLPPKANAQLLFSKKFDKYAEVKESGIKYIDSDGAFETLQSDVPTEQLPLSLSKESAPSLKPDEKSAMETREKDASKKATEDGAVTPAQASTETIRSISRGHYWSVVNTSFTPGKPPGPPHVQSVATSLEQRQAKEKSQCEIKSSLSEETSVPSKQDNNKASSVPVESNTPEMANDSVEVATSETVPAPSKQAIPQENSTTPSTEASIQPTKKDLNRLDESDSHTTDPVLSVEHQIPIALKPDLNPTTHSMGPTQQVPESLCKPDAPKPEPSLSFNIPVRMEQTEPDSVTEPSGLCDKKKHVSYMTKTITREHTIDKRTKTETKHIQRTKRSSFLFDDDDDEDEDGDYDYDNCYDRTDSAYRARSLPLRARSTTPDQIIRQAVPIRSRTISSSRETIPLVRSKTTITPSGRVLYVRSATPSRLPTGGFISKTLQRSGSPSQYRLSEPTVLTCSLPASPVLHARPRVHIYPSPWRSFDSDTVADASTQMAGPLASGYMAGEGVTCYAYTGAHYRKRTYQTPQLVLCKDTSIWTGPDATETFRLEAMFASRLRSKQLKSLSTSASPTGLKVGAVDVVDSKLNVLSRPASAVVESSGQLLNRDKTIQPDKAMHWQHLLFYALACFVALIATVVAYFCLSSCNETDQNVESGFWVWFQNLTFRFRRQQDELS